MRTAWLYTGSSSASGRSAGDDEYESSDALDWGCLFSGACDADLVQPFYESDVDICATFAGLHPTGCLSACTGEAVETEIEAWLDYCNIGVPHSTVMAFFSPWHAARVKRF
jgi:hypothetical protein